MLAKLRLLEDHAVFDEVGIGRAIELREARNIGERRGSKRKSHDLNLGQDYEPASAAIPMLLTTGHVASSLVTRRHVRELGNAGIFRDALEEGFAEVGIFEPICALRNLRGRLG